MSVLVTTVDGYRIYTSSGKELTSLEGHRVECFTPGPDGTFLAVIDRHEVWSHGRDGEWTPTAKSEATLTAVVAAGDAVFAGTNDARVLRLAPPGALEPLAGFDTVGGRDQWHQVGSPLQVRTMTATCDGGAVLVNVHVGGIPRSIDGGATWQPTLPVDDDVQLAPDPLITDFLAQQDSMSEDEARALANEDFAIGKDTSDLKAKWYKKMTKVLSDRTVARFFHIEEKLDAIADLALAANIPLIH